ncbi:hypothetical protein ACFRFU_12875 [Streptomyces sp. NPDC056704]|uniref:hypothetical protein n=1 Tax=Streptomyces sp. NPDC056704 TaxID=3345917 RepID=UPI0036B692EC
MPRGRHRHSPPLHRLLPPSAIAGVSLVCAVGPWLFTEPTVLRALAAAAAVTAVVGGIVMRRWDTAAGKRVADLTRARASDEWRHEERVAELETDLDESRELRTKLEHKLRAKRAELAGLRNEHAALLRRYATAETERASALEGRRLLEIETVAPARALTAATESAESVDAVDAVDSAEPEAPEGVAVTDEDMNEGAGEGEDAGEGAADGPTAEDVTTEAENAAEEPTDAPESPQVFSPAGSSLFLRADAALSRITHGDAATDVSDANADPDIDPDTDPDDDAKPVAEAEVDTDTDTDADADSEAETASDSEAEAESDADAAASGSDEREPAKGESDKGEPPTDGPPKGNRPLTDAKTAALPVPAARAVSVEAEPAAPAAHPVKPTKPARASGHFTVPTAVAVAPAAPVRRPSVEGGFDFFGTQKGASSAAMDAMQNEDLADVVGQEALALHKAEAESGFKPVDEGSRGVGQVIDLTAHDETEHIDLTELRTAAS